MVWTSKSKNHGERQGPNQMKALTEVTPGNRFYPILEGSVNTKLHNYKIY